MNKSLVAALMFFVFSCLVFIISPKTDRRDLRVDNQLTGLRARIEQERATASQQQINFDNERRKLVNQIDALNEQQKVPTALENSGDSELGKLKGKAYEQALAEYQKNSPATEEKVGVVKFFSENFDQVQRTGIEQLYLSSLSKIGIEGLRLQQIIDMLIVGDTEILKLRQQVKQGDISQQEAREQMFVHEPDQVLASVLTATELKQFQKQHQQQNANSRRGKFELNLADNAKGLSQEGRDLILDAFERYRQIGDFFGGRDKPSITVEQRIDATMQALTDMISYLEPRLSETDMAVAEAFFQQQERQFLELEKVMKSQRGQ